MARVSYIYLNTYRSSNGNEYFYVGSHTWNGPLGQLDQSYHGSSKIAALYHWVPVKEEIIEVVNRSEVKTSDRERFWIKEFASRYGIADCAAINSVSADWLLQFPKHGKMLNLHSNSMEQALAVAFTDEVNQKRLQTRIKNGTIGMDACHTPEAVDKARQSIDYKERAKRVAESKKRNGTSVPVNCQTEEAKQKRLQTRRNNGSLDKFIEAIRKPEVQEKRMESLRANGGFERMIKSGVEASHKREVIEKRDYSQSSLKGVATKKARGNKHHYNVVSLFKEGICLNEYCSVNKAAILAGNGNYSVWVNRRFAEGLTEVTHHGYTFKLVERTKEKIF